MDVGALFNVAAIAIAGMLFLQAPLKAPFPVIAIWGPNLLVAFGSTLYAPDFNAAARLVFVLLSYWSFFAIPFFILRSSRDLTRFVLVVIGSSLPPTLYAFVDLARGLSDLHDSACNPPSRIEHLRLLPRAAVRAGALCQGSLLNPRR